MNAFGGPGEDNNRARPNPMVFGTPMQPKPADTSGATVRPQLGAGSGGASTQGAVPSMAYGGAIPDGDSSLRSNAGVTDNTTSQINSALQTVRGALMFGRQMHGLSGGGKSAVSGGTQSDADANANFNDTSNGTGAIPDGSTDSSSDDSDGESYAAGGAIESYDEGGEIENPAGDPNPNYTSEPETAPPVGDDNSGAGPVAGAIPDDSGAPPVMEGAAAPQSEAPVAQQFNNVDSGGPQGQANPQLIISYLEGKGAAPPETLDAYRKQADPTGGMTLAEQNLLAVDSAKKDGGDQSAFPLIQTQRRTYDSYLARARAAFEGVQGRPPDLHEAATAATRAYDNLLDGVSTTFKAEGNGVLASVKSPGVSQAQTFKLSPQQFGTLLDGGKEGMYDAMLERGGAPAILAKVAGAQATVGAAPTATPSGGAPKQSMADYVHNFQQQPAAQNQPQSKPTRDQDDPAAQAQRMYPMASQGAQRAKAEIDLRKIAAKGGGADRMEVEKLRGENRLAVEAEKSKRASAGQAERGNYHDRLIDARLKEVASRTQNTNAHDRRATLNTIVQAAGGYDRLSPDQKKMVDQALNGGQQQQAAPAQQQAPGASSQPTKAQIGEMLRKRGLLQ